MQTTAYRGAIATAIAIPITIASGTTASSF
jgi:hypothetical protein